jgi:hypothetical protein
MSKTKEKFDEVGAIIAFEQGELGEQESLELFQHLVDNGHAWQLQGSYGRTANDLIEAGLIKGKRRIK